MAHGITYEDVVLAATQLQARNINPTIEKIRLELGGKGSNTTISKYLKQWRESSPMAPKDTSLPDPLASAVAALRGQIVTEQKAKIEEVEELASKRVKEITDENVQLQQEVVSTSEEQKSLQEKINTLDTKYRELEGQLLSEKNTSSALVNDVDKLQGLMEEKEKRYLELKEQHSLHLVELEKSWSMMNDGLKEELNKGRELMETQRHEFIVEKDALKLQVIGLEKAKQEICDLRDENAKHLSSITVMTDKLDVIIGMQSETKSMFTKIQRAIVFLSKKIRKVYV